jgi:hypothetical protein
MSNYPVSPGLANSQREAGSRPGDRQRTALDNLLRRELKVGDPTDPSQIARALSERYQNDVRMQSIDGEARGLPFLRTPSIRPVDITTPTATNIDLEQSRTDVNADLQQLVRDNLTKDVRPELEGWQSVINQSIEEGVAAARYGLDPIKRDTAFAMRRQLGEYARLARLVGVLTPTLNSSFRNLATSIDEVCAVMLVLMGESMANVGFAGGRFLLQVPYSELQARRDAVLNALRQVEGVSAQSMSADAWPRGLRSYRQMYTVLEARGQGDIRSLLSETELARTMDELIQTASGGSSGGMRALGATSWAPLNRLTRFVRTTLGQVAPASPGLATLHEALQLFIEGFVPAGGFRLLRVARPTVLNYGLYGPAEVSGAESRLIALVNERGNLARRLDCFTACACGNDGVLAQIVLDKMLYEIDRAIDYYAAGDADLGLPEVRASACAILLDLLVAAPWPAPLLPPPPPPPDPAPIRPAYAELIFQNAGVRGSLSAIRLLLRPIDGVPPVPPTPPGWETGANTYNNHLIQNDAWLGGGPTALRFSQVLHDELRLQQDTDLRWEPVISQMTSGCVPVRSIFSPVIGPTMGCLTAIVHSALSAIEVATAPGPNPIPAGGGQLLETVLPPDSDESLATIAERI